MLIGLLHSDIWQVISHDFSYEIEKSKWQEHWTDCWDSLWFHGGNRLLEGMLHTSRIGDEYPGLEYPLIERSKHELLAWLASGQLKRFEGKLKRELYRRFWGLHLRFTDFVENFFWQKDHELADELEREKFDYENDWELFSPISENLRTLYFGVVTSSIPSLVARMGAEPASQLERAITLPFASPMFAIADIWRTHVNKASFSNFEKELAIWNSLSTSIFQMICLEDVVFVCQKPSVFSIDEGGRLHSASGPALQFADGFTKYAWHGVLIDDPRIIERPETITVDEIERTENIELRRVLMDRYGQSRYLEESGAEVIAEDETGILYRKPVDGDEPLVMVKVVNRTPEPDGSYKEYFLRVPPEIRTAREAVAWTFGFSEPDEYQPDAES